MMSGDGSPLDPDGRTAHLPWPETTSYVTSGAHDARLYAWYRDVVYSDESNGLLTRYLALWQPSAPVGAPAPGP